MYVQVRNTYVPIHKEKADAVGCPLCKSNGGIVITVYQRHISSVYSYKVTNRLTGSAYCRICGKDIPPVAWSLELEKAFLQSKKKAPKEQKRTKFTIRFKIIMFSALLLLVFAIGSVVWQQIAAKRKTERRENIISSPQPGDKWMVWYQYKKNYGAGPHTILKVRRIEGDKIYIYNTTEIFLSRTLT